MTSAPAAPEKNAMKPAAKPAQDRPLAGLLWMLGTTLSFTAVNVIVHYLGSNLPATQTSFVRFAWGWVFVAPALWHILHMKLSPKVWGLFGLRGLLQAIAVLMWFYAMARIPIADVTAIGYLNPIVVSLGGALLLGEGFAWRRGVAVVVALIGALVILRPGMRAIEPGHVAQLGAAFFFGLSYLMMKRLSGLAPATVVVALMTVVVTLCLAPLAVLNWQPMTWSENLWLGATALFATLGHYCMTRAFACAPVTVTQPVVFLQLVWASSAGYVLFGEALDPFVFLGAAMIVGAVSYMAWREAVIKRRKAAQQS
ncbi:threonine/homoserine efflux transporter RhtA [Rhodobacter sp. JA431]|uniref:DMT family transporter n=1 Tax=Rhodobacter sp. JA431 TaxID=570013 RepID=UPI000BC52773|nr:DMT family transporter [Rhodobacter sp. JA431]SOB99416.1 threonine/homoserine efflux transporter RhtA [Rhodobacter sp. JA431]